MSQDDPFSLEDPEKRARLMQLLTGGTFAIMPYSLANAGWWFGSSSKKLADDKSIFTLKGEVLVNGRQTKIDTRIRSGDTVRTGDRSEIAFAVGSDSFLMRSNSEMEISGSGFFIAGLRILSGRLLSVFGKRKVGQQLSMSASTATIGIRGTGVYLEVEPDLTYLCTCYGKVDLSAKDNPDDRETITTNHHDDPRYISSKPNRGSQIRSAPVINHTNVELQLLEAIVGRQVPKSLRKAYSNY
ncbi:MAG: hypothetical protein GY935_12410 [Gammaproteobacteria bacterium]|nr:hypothetical protein [Gammaproteobacteria bacterium]